MLLSLSFILLSLSLITAAVDDLSALRRLSAAVGGRTLRWNFSSPTPCSFSGVICDSASGAVIELRLPAAGLSGQIPPSVLSNFTSLRRLSLRQNSLSGPLPSDFLSGIESLFLQENNFSGNIPDNIFSLSSLRRLVLFGNRISGEISPDFNRLGQLQILLLQNNDLSGSIPQLDNLTNLRIFNVSYNNLTGPVPEILQKFNSDSFINTSFCGPMLSPCGSSKNNGNSLSAGAIAGIVIGSVFGLILLLVIIFILWRRFKFGTSARRTEPRTDTSPAPATPAPDFVLERKYSKSSESGVNNGNNKGNNGIIFLENGGFRFGLEDLLRASAEVLGKGTLGSSYRAYLGGGAAVVVKRLRNVCVGERVFRERVEVFGRLSHENLVGVKGYYFGKGEKLIVYESLPLGSLSSLLHGSDNEPLSWESKARIAYGAACGISYLHAAGPTSSHGNIKSSNILLTDTYTPRISEFCVNHLVSNSSALSTSGYRAPEVTDTRTVSQKADVYSFGIVLLELVTGRDPVDLPRWVHSAVKGKGVSVFVKELVKYENEKIEDMVRLLLELGIECSLVRADTRPVMTEVATRIEELCGLR